MSPFEQFSRAQSTFGRGRISARVAAAREPMDRLRVATLNVSWEANNAIKTGSVYVAQGVPANKSGSRGFARATRAPAPTHSGLKLGNAYEQVVVDLKSMGLDVILLQEFQVYPVGASAVSSVNVLVDKDHLGDYTVVAVGKMMTPRIDPLAACLVLVRTKLLYTGLPTYDLSAVWHDPFNAFPPGGRPVAIADVVLHVGDQVSAPYRLISSHSAHGIPWSNFKVTQNYLDAFGAIKALDDNGVALPVPANLVWGGDFNANLSAFKCTWNATGAPNEGAIRKTPRGSLPQTTEYLTTTPQKFDWVLGTTVSGLNPGNVVVQPTASDHRIVAKTMRAAFCDLAYLGHDV